MVYVLRTHLKKKYMVEALPSVYGIGSFLSKQICRSLGFQKLFKLKRITEEQIFQIVQCVEDLEVPIKGELQREVKQNIDKLVALKVFRGFRHRQGLPIRGQRTHTNARTQKKVRYLRK
jgi:small subunit ribosomal protein S13